MLVQIREGLDWDQAVKELLQAVDYLRSTGSPKVAHPSARASPCKLYRDGDGGCVGGGVVGGWGEGVRGRGKGGM